MAKSRGIQAIFWIALFTTLCSSEVLATAGGQWTIGRDLEHRVEIAAAPGEWVELSLMPAEDDVEVSLSVAGQAIPVWHDGHPVEDGVGCPANRPTTLRWRVAHDPDVEPAELLLRASIETNVAWQRWGRPATIPEQRAWDAHRRLTEALNHEDQDSANQLLEPALQAVLDLNFLGPVTKIAYFEDLAHRFLKAGLIDPAIDLFRRAMALQRARGETSRLADLESGMSTALFYQGRLDEAYQHEAEALAIRRRVLGATHDDVGRSLVELAVVRWQQAQFRKAVRLSEDALRILDRAEPHLQELAEALHIHGEILREIGRFEASEAALKRAVTIWESTGRRGYLHTVALNGLAKLLRDRGRYVEAERLISKALAFSPDPNAESVDTVVRWLNRAELLRLGGQTEDAEPLYRRQLQAARRLFGASNPDLLLHLNQTAVFLTEVGHYEEAAGLFAEVLELAKKTLTIDHPIRAQALDDLGALERRRQRWPAAEVALATSLGMRERLFGKDHPEVAATLTSLAETLSHDSEKDAETLRLLERAARILERTPLYPTVRAHGLALRSELLDRDGRRNEAIDVLGEALEVVEGLRSTAGTSDRSLAGFFGRYRDLYHRRVGWLIDAGRLDQAFETSERARGRAFLDQLAANQVDLLAGLPTERRRELNDQRDAIQARLAEAQFALAIARETPDGDGPALDPLEQSVAERVTELQDVEAAIRAESPLWLRLVTQAGRPVTAADVRQNLLSDRELFVTYDVGPERSFAFVISPQGPLQVLPLELDDEAAALLATSPGLLTTKTLETAVHQALPPRSRTVRGLDEPEFQGDGSDTARHALWRTLMPQELAAQLATTQELIVVPDGALHHLPFELLIPELSPRGQPSRPWIESGPVIRYGLSATILVNLEQRIDPGRRDGVVIVADPRPAEGQGLIAGTLRDLPWTPKEAQAIHGVLREAGVGEVTLLTDVDAREAPLRRSLASPLRLLHVATHGIVEQGSHELLAALALTPPSEVTDAADDGLLQLHEIYRLKLSIDLAVLSACETHRGRDFAGEGAFALSRGFLVAGAERVISSLWPVDDRRTAELMASFYRHLFADGRPTGRRIDQALRDAKRELQSRPDSADPYYWAGFVLIGPS